MSQHHIAIVNGDKQIKLVLGFDRPLKEVFYQVWLDEDECLEPLTHGVLPNALSAVLQDPEKVQAVLNSESVQKAIACVDQEAAAGSAHMLYQYMSEKISEAGGLTAQVQKHIDEVRHFTNFNRVLSYDRVVLQ